MKLERAGGNTARHGGNLTGARTFLSAAASERPPVPKTSAAHNPPHVAADRNVRAPMVGTMSPLPGGLAA